MKPMRNMTEPELRELFNILGGLIKAVLGPDAPWLLLVAEGFDERGVCQYVANGNRADIIAWLRETAQRLAGGEDETR